MTAIGGYKRCWTPRATAFPTATSAWSASPRNSERLRIAWGNFFNVTQEFDSAATCGASESSKRSNCCGIHVGPLPASRALSAAGMSTTSAGSFWMRSGFCRTGFGNFLSASLGIRSAVSGRRRTENLEVSPADFSAASASPKKHLLAQGRFHDSTLFLPSPDWASSLLLRGEPPFVLHHRDAETARATSGGSPSAAAHFDWRNPWRRPHRNRARKPSCSKCRSSVSASMSPSRRMVCIEMQSVRL